jgi:glycosyltransferase involved in cell wall biosynthesis
VFLMVDSLRTGGSERQFAALAQALDPSAFALHLGCLRRAGGFATALGEIAEFGLGGSLYGWQSIRTRLRLARYLRRSKIAVAHAFDFYTNLLLIPVARMIGVPVIGSLRQLGDLLTPAQWRAQCAAFRWCDRVVSNSNAAAERLIASGLPQGKVQVIGNGLAPEYFARVAPALPRRSDVLRVGMVARMNTRDKNHRNLLGAVARLQPRFPGLELILVGDGPLRPELEDAARSLGLGDGVRFLGDRRDVPAVLASVDVSAMPSDSESLSNAILESMAAGVPVVATRVGGNPELIAEDRGLLVLPRDEGALSGAIARLLEDGGLRASFGEAGRRFALANFTMERMRVRHEELYRELLVRKGWRPRAEVKTGRAAGTGQAAREEKVTRAVVKG